MRLASLRVMIFLQHFDQIGHDNRQQFVERIHATTLDPLGYRLTSVLEAKFLQDVIHANRLNTVARP